MPAAAFRALSEALTKALLSGDLGLYRMVFRLPLRIEARNSEAYVIRDEADLQRDFDLYRIAIIANGVTDFDRRIISIETIQPDSARICVEMNILHNAERIVQPFQSRFTMQLVGDDWRITAIESAPGHIRWTLGEAPLDGRDLD